MKVVDYFLQWTIGSGAQGESYHFREKLVEFFAPNVSFR